LHAHEGREAPLDNVLARLHGVRRNGNGWISHCPAHPDRSPSLAVSEGRDGRVLLHCFSGCSAESICEAIQIRVSDLFSEPWASRKRKPETVQRVEKQIAGLRSRLTPRERILPITVVYCDPENLDAGTARALALAVEGELVQVALDGESQ
jgi:hypothetical protein